MKENLNIFENENYLLFFKCKTTVIFFQMKYNLIFFQMDDNLNLIQTEHNLNILAKGRQPKQAGAEQCQAHAKLVLISLSC
jgi:hypothetical protein